MYFLLVLYPILGAGIKYIDDAFDEQIFSKRIALVLAPALGLLWAYAMIVDKASAVILLAILCAVLLKGKKSKSWKTCRCKCSKRLLYLRI